MKKLLTYGLVVLFLLFPRPVQAQAQAPAAVTVEVSPAAIKLGQGKTVTAAFVVRNPTADPLENVVVTYPPAAGVQIDVTPKAGVSVPANSARIWQITLTQTTAGVLTDTLQFQAAFNRKTKDGLQANVLFAALAVSSPDPINLSKTLSLTTLSSMTELNDFRPGIIYLEAQNLSSAPVTITSIEVAERPDFIHISFGKVSSVAGKPLKLENLDNRVIEPGDARIYPFEIKSQGQIRPGKHLLLFKMDFQQVVNGQTQLGSVTGNYSFDVKVFGEGEILGALTSVTSFLVLPGFLMVVMVGLLWRLFVPKVYRPWLAMDAKSAADPRFWVIAITLSLLMAMAIYPWISRYIRDFGGGGRNYLSGYNFQDIFWIWLISIALGLVAALLSALVLWSYLGGHTLYERNKARKMFHDTDEPQAVLEKLIDEGYQPILFRPAKIKTKQEATDGAAASTPNFVYIASAQQEGKESLWVIPRIAIKFTPGNEGSADDYLDLISQGKTLRDLVNKIKEDRKPPAKIATIKWQEGDIRWPTYYSRSQLEIRDEMVNTIFIIG